MGGSGAEIGHVTTCVQLDPPLCFCWQLQSPARIFEQFGDKTKKMTNSCYMYNLRYMCMPKDSEG